MKIVTKKQQVEIDRLIIKKLRFVVRATLENVRGIVLTKEDIELAQANAEQVFYADDVI